MRRLLPVLALLIIGFSTGQALAQPTVLDPGGSLGGCNFITGEIHFQCIPPFIGHLVQVIFFFVGSIALLQIIISGYQMAIGKVTGNDEEGKKRLRTAIMGFAVSVLAFFIIDVIITAVAQ